MHVAQKVNDLHESKVIPYLEQQLRYGHVVEVLSLFPGIVEQHPDLADRLEAIHQRALEKERQLDETQSTRLDVSQLRCPGCDAVLHHAREDAKAIACSYCGTRFELADPAGTQEKINDPQRYRPRSLLRLGMIGQLAGKPYQIVGRMRWQGECREWDSEDGKWESTSWTYEEWMLLGEDRSFAYISHDNEGLELSYEFTPSKPGLPERNDRSMTLETTTPAQEIEEHGRYNLAYFEGEFGWVPQLREGLRTAEYSWKGQTFSVDARLDPQSKQPVEIEFFKSRSLSVRELLEAFDRKEELAELSRREGVAGQYRFWRRVACVAGWLLIIGGFLLSTPGDPVATDQFSFTEVGADGHLIGPFNLSAVGRAHTIEVSSSFGDNSWAWVGTELLDANQDSINALAGDFWRESGYDEGHWSESELTSREYFRLEQPGEYYLRVTVDPGTAQTGNIQVSVRENAVLGRYYYLAGIGALIIALFLIRVTQRDDLLRGVKKPKAKGRKK